jgi:cytosine/adenosine deaminase-related metal-dependent hydrolase
VNGRSTAPGWVNAHTHLYSALAPFGMPIPDPPPATFTEILQRVWWRLDRSLDAPSLAAAARWGVAQARALGTVGLADHHESPGLIEGSLEIVADACQRGGMPALLCYGATERNGGQEEARRGLAECRRFIGDNRRPLVRGAVGLHASFTVGDETIREAAALCRELGTVLHVHVAEDLADIDDARRRGWPGPLERLEALGALVPGSILAHGVHLTADQVRRASTLGCWLVQNPRSNRGNHVGYPSALRASTRVALGSDGWPSDMTAEVSVIQELAAAHGDDPAAALPRLQQGTKLLAERFGGTVPTPAPTADLSLAAIEAEAAGEARALWSRMAEL